MYRCAIYTPPAWEVNVYEFRFAPSLPMLSPSKILEENKYINPTLPNTFPPLALQCYKSIHRATPIVKLELVSLPPEIVATAPHSKVVPAVQMPAKVISHKDAVLKHQVLDKCVVD